MRVEWRVKLLIRVLLAVWLPSFVLLAGASSMGEDLPGKLTTVLSQFAKDNHLNDDQLERLLGQVVLERRMLAQGGVGIIDGDTFIVVNGKRNSLILGKQRWEGQDSNQSEVVITDGHRVFGSMADVELESVKVVIFSPGDVRFIDLSTNSGGRYLRTTVPTGGPSAPHGP